MKRSKFNLSNYHLLTMDMGKLIPINWLEAIPGDSIQQSTRALIRCSPLFSPVFHPVRVRIHHWFVPNRLLWENWESFITGGPDGEDDSEVPTITIDTVIASGSLADYLGVPIGDYTSNPITVSALPFRAMNLIYNEWYRDQDLIQPLETLTTDGDDPTAYTIQNISWEKDYFTTCRPWEQKGISPHIPLGDSAPVVGNGAPDFNVNTTVTPLYGVDAQQQAQWSGPISGTGPAAWDDPKLTADLSQATGIAINDLRLALGIQRYQEARAQYGSRYVEYLRSLGVRSSDARLDNPEFLGGGRSTIQFSEVIQTTPDLVDPETSFVGTLRGHGISGMKSNKYRRFFEEHGIVITMLSVVPKAMYTTGLDRSFSRVTKEDYFQKELQFLGDQEVFNKEIQTNHTAPEGIFGYQQRYDEYRQAKSQTSGEMNDILNYWHYARDFSGDVALNQSFIDAVPTKRVNAEQTTDVLYVMCNNSIQARRMLQPNPKPKTF